MKRTQWSSALVILTFVSCGSGDQDVGTRSQKGGAPEGREVSVDERAVKETNNTLAANVQLTLDPRTNPLTVDVESEGNKVVLRGSVTTTEEKKATEQVVEEVVFGEVENRLVVEGVSASPQVVVGTWFIRFFLGSMILVLACGTFLVWLARRKKRKEEALRAAL